MGDPRRQKKKYVTPKRPFDSDRFEQELQLIGTYGLRNKKELWNVLDLTLDNVLDRRLQTIIFRKGLACSMHHARQLVTHGHIALDGARVTTPRRIITAAEEDRLMFTPKSALNSESHPARVAASDAAIRASQPPEEVDESNDRFGGHRDGRRRQGGGRRR